MRFFFLSFYAARPLLLKSKNLGSWGLTVKSLGTWIGSGVKFVICEE